ncbi:amidase family protein [Umezawaea sp. Da 62-37]|uniref:amidase n=1 Tax=Umezawaea sp. Da 62-37 TaxID=3075927 RepID=UPI0028F6D936|nr:amidase family protein [Umezawaea sp. Da 62-37]WNV88070.1 amidase family protein [Umezawaea sp. Da 62-37]
MGDLRYAGAAELRARYSTKEVSPTEHVRATLDLLEETQPELRAFTTVTADLALAQAAEAERLILADGEGAWLGRSLLGVPVSVKDLTPTAGVRTTRGSLLRAHWVPEQDAPAVARLRGAGAVLIGKTSTSEFGWSAGTANRITEPVANPWDRTRSAGGSSGGAAAATAAGIGVAALGTDGAGSIRIPAAFCGVVGYKPTFGRVPYVPMSPEGLSHLGPLARDVATARLVADVIAGPHPDDPLSTPRLPRRSWTGAVRVAWLRWPDESGEVAAIARAAADELGDVVEVEPPFTDPYPHLVTILAAFDAGQRPEDDALSDPFRLRVVEHGRRLSAADLAHALTERQRLLQQVDALMRRFDVVASPTAWIEPFAVDRWRPDDDGDDLDWLAWCRAAYPFNLTGQPAVSVPAGFTAAGLPVGLHLAGRRHEDDLLLDVAERFETARPWRHQYLRRDQG